MKLLIWDFDGTLGYREGGAWTASLLEVLQREVPDSPVTLEHLRPYMAAGFPWQKPEEPHLQLDTPDKWWAALNPLFVKAYVGVGLSPDLAQNLAAQFQSTYLNPDRWRCYEDVVPSLSALAGDGWTHVVLSNHVPELDDILDATGLLAYFINTFNSAIIGYEKPHPKTFEIVIESMRGNLEKVWMIGDNFRADIEGAQHAGLPAILVRRFHPDAPFYAETLWDLCTILNAR